MNTAARRPGRRLYGRKPAQAKPRERARARTSSSSWSVAASIAKYPQATAASVAARPSMLSSRLNALVIPTSQTTATIVASRSFPISSTRRPAAIAMPAAANCATSFASGLRCRTSSTSPAAKERSAGEDSRELRGSAPARRSGPPRRHRRAGRGKMPTPPNVGVLRSCHRSSVGWATRCRRATASAGGGGGRARQPAGRRSSPRSQP